MPSFVLFSVVLKHCDYEKPSFAAARRWLVVSFAFGSFTTVGWTVPLSVRNITMTDFFPPKLAIHFVLPSPLLIAVAYIFAGIFTFVALRLVSRDISHDKAGSAIGLPKACECLLCLRFVRLQSHWWSTSSSNPLLDLIVVWI